MLLGSDDVNGPHSLFGMFTLKQLAVFSASLLAFGDASPLPPTPPGTIFCALAMKGPPVVVSHLQLLGYALRSVIDLVILQASTTGTAVSGLELAVDSGFTNAHSWKASNRFIIVTDATLETTGFTGGWTLQNGGIGAFDGCHNFWFNIGTSVHSYKPL